MTLMTAIWHLLGSMMLYFDSLVQYRNNSVRRHHIGHKLNIAHSRTSKQPGAMSHVYQSTSSVGRTVWHRRQSLHVASTACSSIVLYRTIEYGKFNIFLQSCRMCFNKHKPQESGFREKCNLVLLVSGCSLLTDHATIKSFHCIELSLENGERSLQRGHYALWFQSQMTLQFYRIITI